MVMFSPISQDDTLPKILHEPEVREALGVSRWKIWDLCRNDDDFPKPRMIGGKRSWFLIEIKDYMESRPRRQYADRSA